MAHFYFFTDNDILSAQTGSQAFGPVSATPETVYRTTSLHTASSDPGAYAVCDGIVLFQHAYTVSSGTLTNTAHSTLVNIILRPTAQPPYSSVPIKYIIYRGVKLSSILDGTVTTQIAPRTTTDLTALYWEYQDKRNAKTGATDNPSQSATGIDLAATGSGSYEHTDPISKIFFADGATSQLIQVDAGTKLGTFDKDNIGIDIVLDAVGFDPTLDLARRLENVITVTALPGTPTKKDVFAHYHAKEAILNFMDPCAFFGSFHVQGLYGKPSGGGTFELKSRNGIYDDLVSKFANKNIVYIDIRNEYNRSLDYMKNYGNFATSPTSYAANIQAGFDPAASTLSTRNYNSWDGHTWPIHTVKNADLPTTNTGDVKNFIEISLPDGGGDNTLPLIYLSQGYLYRGFPDEPRSVTAKFIALEVTGGFTDTIELAAGNRDGLSSTTLISCYFRFNYLKQFDASQPTPVSSGTVVRASTYLDHLFRPFAMTIPFGTSSGYRSVVYDDPVFVDATAETGLAYIARTGMAEDSDSYVFFAVASEYYASDGPMRTPLAIVGERDDSKGNFLEALADKRNQQSTTSSWTFTHRDLSLVPSGTADYVNFESDVELAADDFTDVSDDDVALFVISKTEFTTLQGLVSGNFLAGYDVFLGISSKQDTYDADGTAYTVATLVLRGYEDDLVNTSVDVKEVTTTINIYSYGNV